MVSTYIMSICSCRLITMDYQHSITTNMIEISIYVILNYLSWVNEVPHPIAPV